MVYVTKDNWQQEVAAADVPVVVDFFATWCGPCKMLAPILEGMTEKYSHFKIVKCDVDQAPDLADAYKIRVVPTLILFRDGQAVKTHEGGLPEADLLATFGL